MSIRIMSRAWDIAPYSGEKLLVVLALADFSNDSGSCFPSIETIAKKCRITDRSVYRIITSLQSEGVLTKSQGGGRGKVNSYQFSSNYVNTDKLSPLTEKTLTQDTQNPDIGRLYNKEEPSLTLTPSASDSLMAEEDGGLHHEVAKTIKQEYERINKIKCPWDVSEGAALKKLLKSNPSWDFPIIRKMVMNRFLSDGVNGERPRIFIPHLSRWAAGPLDRYGKVKEQKAAEQFNLTGGLEQVMANRRANGFH